MSCTQNETSAGDTDTEVNELAAIPTGTPSTTAHTAVTPDGKHAKARRSCPGVRTGSIPAIPAYPSAGAVTTRSHRGEPVLEPGVHLRNHVVGQVLDPR